MTTISHTPDCERVLREWLSHPAESVEHRLADFARLHTDPEIRDLLLTVFDEDQGTTAVGFAFALWPLLTPAAGPIEPVDADLAETVDEYDDVPPARRGGDA